MAGKKSIEVESYESEEDSEVSVEESQERVGSKRPRKSGAGPHTAIEDFCSRFKSLIPLQLFIQCLMRRIEAPSLVATHCQDWGLFTVFFLSQLIGNEFYSIEPSKRTRKDGAPVRARPTSNSTRLRNFFLCLASMHELSADNPLMDERSLEVIKREFSLEQDVPWLQEKFVRFTALKKGNQNFSSAWTRLYEKTTGSVHQTFRRRTSLDSVFNFLVEDDSSWTMNARELMKRIWELTSDDPCWKQLAGHKLDLLHGTWRLPSTTDATSSQENRLPQDAEAESTSQQIPTLPAVSPEEFRNLVSQVAIVAEEMKEMNKSLNNMYALMHAFFENVSNKFSD